MRGSWGWEGGRHIVQDLLAGMHGRPMRFVRKAQAQRHRPAHCRRQAAAAKPPPPSRRRQAARERHAARPRPARGEGVRGGRGAGWKAGMMREGGRAAPEWRGSRLTKQHMRDHVVGVRAAPEWRGSRPYGLALALPRPKLAGACMRSCSPKAVLSHPGGAASRRRRAGGGHGPACERVSGRASYRRVRQRAGGRGAAAAASGRSQPRGRARRGAEKGSDSARKNRPLPMPSKASRSQAAMQELRCARPLSSPLFILDAGAGAGAAARPAPRARPRLRETRRGSSGEA